MSGRHVDLAMNICRETASIRRLAWMTRTALETEVAAMRFGRIVMTLLLFLPRTATVLQAAPGALDVLHLVRLPGRIARFALLLVIALQRHAISAIIRHHEI